MFGWGRDGGKLWRAEGGMWKAFLTVIYLSFALAGTCHRYFSLPPDIGLYIAQSLEPAPHP